MTLALYTRVRGGPVALSGVIGSSVSASMLAQHLTAQPRFGQMVCLPLGLITALSCAVLLTATVHSPLAELEASTPKTWWRWRVVHAAVIASGGAVLLAPALPFGEWGAGVLIRDFAGFTGLALVAAAALSPRLAWTLPCAYGAAAYLTGGTDASGWHAVLGFPTQPWQSTPAAATAAALLLVGTVLWGSGPAAPAGDRT